MKVNNNNYGLQIALDTFHRTSEVRCLQILQTLGNPLKHEMKEPIRWAQDFKSNNFKLKLQIFYAHTEHLIQNIFKYYNKVTYNYSIDLLKVLTGPTVMIEKRVFAKET